MKKIAFIVTLFCFVINTMEKKIKKASVKKISLSEIQNSNKKEKSKENKSKIDVTLNFSSSVRNGTRLSPQTGIHSQLFAIDQN